MGKDFASPRTSPRGRPAAAGGATQFAVLMWRRGEGIDDAFADLPARV